MNVKIKSIKLFNFKGFESAEYNFDAKDVIDVKGKNGAGKTTIATAFYWLFADKDYGLKSNPPVRTVGAEENEPRVEIVLDVDGKEVEVAKYQKRSVKKSKINDAETVSLKNVYEVNSIEYGEKEFKSKLEEYGINSDLFLSLTHMDVFVGKEADEMRKVLFGMVNKVSDVDICREIPECDLLSTLLENYTIDEVKAKQNGEIKKIREVYGKSGEILNAKIQGLKSAKSNVDVVGINKLLNNLKEELESNLDKQTDLSKQFKYFSDLANEVMELKFAQGDIKSQCHTDFLKRNGDAEFDVLKKRNILCNICSRMEEINANIVRLRASIKENEESILNYRNAWKKTKEMKFDEASLICPMCNQYLPEEVQKNLVEEFETKKKEKLEEIVKDGERVKNLIIEGQTALNAALGRLSELEKEKADAEKELADAKAKHIESLKPINAEETAEWKKLQAQIDEKEKVLKDFSSIQNMGAALKNEESEIRCKINELMVEKAKSENDACIDEQIDELKESKIKYEQKIADAENILNQINIFGLRKNEILTNEINSKFNFVEFKLFEQLKNGEYKEVCVPTINKKDLNISTNTGLELAMKLDIIKGLQRFYKMHYPVFIDGAECLDVTSRSNIEMDSQIVFLTVSNDELSFSEV